MAWKLRTCFFLLLCTVCGLLFLQGRWSSASTTSYVNSRKTIRLQEDNGSADIPTDGHETSRHNKQVRVPGHFKVVKAAQPQSPSVHYLEENQQSSQLLSRNGSGNGSFDFQAHAHTIHFLQPEVSNGDEHTGRVNNLRRVCRDRNLFKAERRKALMSDVYYSSDHDFAYCKVPKSGSTFWMELFLVLRLGKSYASYLLNHSRSEIHEKTRKFMSEPRKVAQSRSRMVIVSRNPFSRLHSAYVDKVYLPLFWDQFSSMEGTTLLSPYYVNNTRTVLKKTQRVISDRLLKYKELWLKRGLIEVKNISAEVKPICSNNSTFEHFLRFIISVVESGKVLESHWAPISHLCRPCMFNTFKIVKQESFAEDVLDVLSTFGVNISMYTSLKDSLNEDIRAQRSSPGIIRVIDTKAHNKNVAMCIAQDEITRRLWKAFQIQGFISDESAVPVELFNGKFNRWKVTQSVLDAIAAKPLSVEERTEQRHRHLVEAYRGVSPETIEKIMSIYKLDFLLFDYPLKIPS